MNDDIASTADISAADSLFRKRQRILRGVTLVWVLGNLGRIPPVAKRWPAVADSALFFIALGSLIVCAFAVWAARCTICGGGIRLNGRTCDRCGHVFVRTRK